MTQAKSGPKGPHGKPRVVPGTMRQMAWRAMQIKGKFTLADLVRAVVPADNAAQDPRNNVGRYVKALTRAGILAELPKRAAPRSPTSNGDKRWLLLRDLGRQAPVIRAAGGIFDPNSGAVIGEPAGVTPEEASDES